MAAATENIMFIGDPASPNPFEPSLRFIDLNVLEADQDAEGWGIVPGSVTLVDPQQTFEDTAIGGYGISGDLQAATRYGRGILRFKLFYSPSNNPTRSIGEAGRELSSALNTPGIIVFQKKGDEEQLFFDYDRSPSVGLLHGQEMGLFVIGHLQTEFEGVDMFVICGHPHPRVAQITYGPFTVDNSPDGRSIKIDNPGDVHGELQIAVEPVAGSLVGVRYALRGHGSEAGIDEFRDIHAHALADTAINKVDAADAVVADASGVGGKAVVIDFVSEESMERRLRDKWEPAEPDSIDGVHMLIARMTATGGTPKTTKHRLRASYGFSSGDLQMQPLRRYPMDWRDIDVPRFVDFELGRVVVPRGAPRLIVDLDVDRPVGDQSLVMDQFFLEPADIQRGIVGVPGFRLGSWARVEYQADDLDGTGELKRDAYRLNEPAEVARIGPAAGRKLTVGVHEFDVETMLREPLEDEDEMAVFEAIRNPGVDDELIASLPLRTKEGQVWTRRERTLAFAYSQAFYDDDDKILVRVRQTRGSANRRRTHVLGISHRLMEAFSTDQPLVIDPIQRRAIASDGPGTTTLPLFQAIHENDPPLSPPGPQAWTFSLLDRVVDAGYRDADEREPLGRSVLDREAEITLVLTPRRWAI